MLLVMIDDFQHGVGHGDQQPTTFEGSAVAAQALIAGH